MLRFDWSAFITPDLLARLASETQVPLADVTRLAPRLAQVLAHAGGLPFTAAEPSLQARTARGVALLCEAATHALDECGVRPLADGLVRTANNEVAEQVPAQMASQLTSQLAQAVPLLDANRADEAEWARLPGITPKLAQLITDERARGGRFTSLSNLEQRVDGIGPVRAAQIEGAVSFASTALTPLRHASRSADLGEQWRVLMLLQSANSATEALVKAVDAVLTSVATTPHPASRHARLREAPAAPPAVDTPADWVGELWGEDYWRALPALMDGAAHDITVCMFHIAAPNEKHPTFALLQGLVRARQRGVQVRVLVDRDGKTDPYRSSLINSAAKKYLLEAGVACRSDSSHRLLHSKYLVIDQGLVVMGSHNWSAGSYFDFDDLTLALNSPALAQPLLQRFDKLWAAGS